MVENKEIQFFLSFYSQEVYNNALKVRDIILRNLPEVQEQIDIPAKMVAYSYGNKYVEMVCTIIPSQKGVKLGFYKGTELNDPENLLKGTGKISRYVEIKKEEEINEKYFDELLQEAFIKYRIRNNK